jgi:hypothetical protein
LGGGAAIGQAAAFVNRVVPLTDTIYVEQPPAGLRVIEAPQIQMAEW